MGICNPTKLGKNESSRVGNVAPSSQPSNSPNDPLNWPLTRKLWHTFLLLLVTGLASATTNSAWMVEEAMLQEYKIAYGDMDIGGCVLYIGIGLGTFLLSPVASLYGHRLPYIICITLNIFGMIWMSLERSRQESIYNQLFVGASGAVAEANVQLSLSEIWFEHQRGRVLGLYVLMTSVGTFLGPLLSGIIVDKLGWRWVPLLSLIISGITLVIFYFGLEETLFERHRHENHDTSDRSSTCSNVDSQKIDLLESGRNKESKQCNLISSDTYSKEPKNYWSRIQLVTYAPGLIGCGFHQYITGLQNTLGVFVFPAVFYSGIQWGAQDAWLNFYLTLQQEDWMNPPFNFSQTQSAMMNIPTMIGAIIGCFWGGYLSDYFMAFMKKRKNGAVEAEDRLWMMLPCFIISPSGFLIFGVGTADTWNRYWSYLGLGLIGFGWGCAGDLSMTYLMDVYPDIVLEGMVGVSLISNCLAGIFSVLSDYWLVYSGVRNCMISVAGLCFFFFILTVPMMIWGKSCQRSTFDKYKLFVKSRNRL